MPRLRGSGRVEPRRRQAGVEAEVLDVANEVALLVVGPGVAPVGQKRRERGKV